ncbi:MAG: riboflavin biosynthesis protein RibF [Elusimicrobia bacterium]|nr:riboflavin biosynthesis protein RibF [Elusimicrobiota bacterium]
MPSQPERYLVTIGTFDGVHRGHRKLLAWVRDRARLSGLKTRVVFFIAPPRFYFKPDLRVPLLSSGAERRTLLKSLGIDRVEVLRFGARWAEMPHTAFFERYIVGRWKAAGLLVGRDFAFGRGRLGDLAFLKAACQARKMSLGVLPLVRVNGRKISSSRIRLLLAKGDVGAAARQLGRRYAVSGRVIHGQHMGRKLGFPTANVRVPAEVMAPPGVYEVLVSGPWADPKRAVCNVGVRPTLDGEHRRHVEVHVPGWTGRLYHRELKVEFVRRLRGERRFPSLSALKRQIARDVARVSGPGGRARRSGS